MAAITIPHIAFRFPVGTEVSAYKGRVGTPRPDGLPEADVAGKGTVQKDGSLTVEGLDAGLYWLYAEVDDRLLAVTSTAREPKE